LLPVQVRVLLITRLGRWSLCSSAGGGDRDLITSRLVLFGRRTRDAPLPATDLARWWIDPAAGPSWLNHGRKAGTVASLTFYFKRGVFLSHAAC
jgi:hypothetical protein